jgi:transcriptional regulator GlxA family with amidase domain
MRMTTAELNEIVEKLKQTAPDFVRSDTEAATRLNMSVRTLRRLRQRGEGPAYVQLTERIRGVRDSAINAYLDSKTV